MPPQTYPWSTFRGAMAEVAGSNEFRCEKLYKFVEAYDRFVGGILDRPHGLDSARPQDYLACILLARSFRLLIGGLWLAASGYGDLSPNLGRTMWEIAIRLFYSQQDPVAASFGFFIHAETRHLESMEAELAHRRATGEEVGHLAANCTRARDHRAHLESVARTNNVDVAAAVSRFGKLNMREACREMEIEKAYLVDYAFDSGHVHERNVTTASFLTVSDGVGQYELGPTHQEHACAATFDLLRNFSLVAEGAARLVEDADAVTLAETIQEQLRPALEECERGISRLPHEGGI